MWDRIVLHANVRYGKNEQPRCLEHRVRGGLSVVARFRDAVASEESPPDVGS